MLNKLFKSIIDTDKAPIVVCDTQHTVVYMNPSAIKHYKKDITGQRIKLCHPDYANEKIDDVVSWFKKSKDNSVVYTYRSEKENKDVYMIALRDTDGTLLGYYEKHEYRDVEVGKLYSI